MRTLLFLFLSTLGALAQGGAYCTMSTWEPRNLATKAGLVASYDFGNQATLTGNPSVAEGNGISQVLDRAMKIRTGNLLLQSEAFNTTWARQQINAFGATDTGAAGAGSFANTARTTDPLGGNTADFIQEDNTLADHSQYQFGLTTSYVTGTRLTYSVCLKAGGRNWVSLRLTRFSSSDCVWCYFDLANGTNASPSHTASGYGETASMLSLGNGWYQCSISGIPTTTNGSSILAMHYCATGNQGITIPTYTGDNTSGVYLWGASLVKSDWTPVTGTSLALGYQATTTTAYAPPDLVQSTAANQPLLSRSDNAGNLLKQSEAFNTTWTLTRVNAFGATDTGAAGAGSFANTARTTDPLGGNTADFIQEDNSSALSHAISQTATIPIGTRITFSIFAKKDTRDRICLRDNGGWLGGVGFDLTGGTTFSVTGLTLPTSYSITSVGGGWYLCSASEVVAGSNQMLLYLLAGTDLSYNGNNTGGVFFWGASLTPSTWTPVTGTSASLGYVATTTVPIYAGLSGRSVAYFDGSAYYMKSAALFPLVQPTTLYTLSCPLTWTLNDAMFDGYALNSGNFYQSATTPNVRQNAGTIGTEYVPQASGLWRVYDNVFDGASSRIGTNGTGFAVSDAGTTAMNGFTLGAAGTVGTTFWNGLVGRQLICNKTNATAEASYLRWGLMKQAVVY